MADPQREAESLLSVRVEAAAAAARGVAEPFLSATLPAMGLDLGRDDKRAAVARETFRLHRLARELEDGAALLAVAVREVFRG